ncbi:hypothetical protein [Lacticaseibacillus thailandensis]|uniref:hypothetical protein n=1 Tax=Lacticaseibacillus thailandensis TaxID=381741 RepID=UPI00138F2FFD|nr:hypothetical protein [Lacticaseibacillus thailandensis]
MPLFGLNTDDLATALDAGHDLVAELSHVCLEFKHAYWAEKQRRHVLDFGDIEQAARTILDQADPDTGTTVGQIYRDAFDEVWWMSTRTPTPCRKPSSAACPPRHQATASWWGT